MRCDGGERQGKTGAVREGWVSSFLLHAPLGETCWHAPSPSGHPSSSPTLLPPIFPQQGVSTGSFLMPPPRPPPLLQDPKLADEADTS